jgi:LuxR family transcriptional regulator, maltose regulon positive regulatory protein
MHSILLRAKLHRPAPTAGAIPRPRLLRRLEDGLSCKVTLVSAAAGFGKSCLLSAWLDHALPRFLRYVVAAIEDSFPRQCDPLVALRQERPNAPADELADTLANCLVSLPGPFVLVLDDLHVIDNPAIHALLTRLVAFGPPWFHLVLSARVDPPQLPLTRWRARGWLNELRQRELSFTAEEVAAFLGDSAPGPQPAELAATLHHYTDGWPVGLRLALLAWRGHADPAAFLANTVANRNRFALDYLRDEVLEQQPAAVQAFLLKTAILKRFCPALCAAVVQIDEAEAEQTLREIERANLFLIDLSSPPEWYRFHHQFQSTLLSKLSEWSDREAVADLHRRAAAWLSAHGELPEALEYLLAIDDLAAAADTLERHRSALVSAGRTQELSDALSLLPEQLLSQRPLLLLSAAWLDSWRLEWEACATKVRRAEQLLQVGASGADWTEATRVRVVCELVALRCAMDHRLEGQVTLAAIREAWEQVQPHLAGLPATVISALAEQCHFLGDHQLGLAIFDTALRQSGLWPFAARHELLSRRTTVLFWNCDLSAVEQALQFNRWFAQQHGIVADAGITRLTLGVIAAARHQLADCERYLRAVLTDLSLDNAKCVMMAVSRLIEVFAYQGRLDDARQALDLLKAFARPLGLRYLHDHAAAMEAYLAMMCGDAPAALAWVLGGLHQGPAYHPQDRLPIIRARILVTEGSPASLQAARQILDAYIQYMERHHMRFYLVEGLILQALALAGLGQAEQALATLASVVQLAVPKGIVGRFIQRGQPMQRLLQEFCSHPAYSEQAPQARLLLAAFPSADTAAQAEPAGESLSERECDVLRLMAEGLSNKAIAQRLLISAYTVRNHTVNIFGKLQVENRLQAVERARALGLLSKVVHG